MESRAASAEKRRTEGYSCSQSVACTYCDLFGMDEDTMYKIIEGFGSGMADMQGTCGAVSGAIALAGLKCSGGLAGGNTKKNTYQLVKEIKKYFQEKNGSVICSELKGLETGKVLRSCPGCIEDACHAVEAVLLKEE